MRLFLTGLALVRSQELDGTAVLPVHVMVSLGGLKRVLRRLFDARLIVS